MLKEGQVNERERQRERQRDRDRDRERQRETERDGSVRFSPVFDILEQELPFFTMKVNSQIFAVV